MSASGILLSSIRRDGGTQIRAALDEATVTAYAELYAAGAKLPPVKVYWDKADVYWLVDGFHRVEAALRAGVKRLPFDATSGERRDAILYACGANAEHGLPRSNADKRRAVDTLLADPEWRAKSDAWIAKAAKVHRDTVVTRRAEVSETVDLVTARHGLDGKQYKIRDSRGSGSNAGAPEAASNAQPDAGDEHGGDEGAATIVTGKADDGAVPGEPARPWAAFEAALNAFDNHLRSAQACLAPHLAGPYAAWAEATRRAAHGVAAQARSGVRPAADCLYCKDPDGASGRRHECHGCKGLGYLTEEQLGAVPRELRDGDKVVDQKRGGFVDALAKQVAMAVAGAHRDAIVDGLGLVQVKGGTARRLRIEDGAGRELVVERDEDIDGGEAA